MSKSIIQFSPPRSGSTLVYNILRVIEEKSAIEKRHNLNEGEFANFSNLRIVSSVRDPVDSIASSLLRYEKKPTKGSVADQIKEFKQNGLLQMTKVRGWDNALVLRYEDFVKNWGFLFENLEAFFGYKIPYRKRKVCEENFNIESVYNKGLALGSFSNYSVVDQIHGKHVSQFKGQFGYGYTMLGEDLSQEVRSEFQEFCNAFQY
jgi:hypothetical protein